MFAWFYNISVKLLKQMSIFLLYSIKPQVKEWYLCHGDSAEAEMAAIVVGFSSCFIKFRICRKPSSESVHKLMSAAYA